MSADVRVSGAWKKINGIHTRVSGVWKEVSTGHVRVSGVWKQFYPTIPPVPAGLIIPYNGLSAPTGWSAFTDANGYFIIGADGATYVVSNTGGNSSIIVTLNSAGSHAGADHSGIRMTSGSNYYYGRSSQGNHSHTCTIATPNLKPPYQNVYLIKADSELAKVPQDGVVLAEVNLAGLSNIWTGSNLLRAFTDLTTGSQLTKGQESINAGAHRHSNNASRADANNLSSMEGTTRGGHTHIPTFTFTQNAMRYKLSAWTHASASFNLTLNMIGMYESMTPPDGWSLCDGNNGTPDLRTYFIQLKPGPAGGTDGNNNWSTGGSVAASGAHWHNKSNQRAITQVTGEHSNSTTFGAHTWGTGFTWLPSWYALAFIMYTG